jgi:hypothetical protein
MLTMHTEGFGAVTKEQIAAFTDAMRGCALYTDADAVKTRLVTMLKAYPDPADRIMIRQALVTRSSSDTLCQKTVAEAFTELEAKPYVPPFYTQIWFWGAVAGALAVGGGVFYYVRRKR